MIVILALTLIVAIAIISIYKINSTCSSIGEEYLYSKLNDKGYDEKKLSETELQNFFNPIDKKLRHYKVFSVLSVAAAISIVSFLLKSPMGIWPILLMAIINITIVLGSPKVERLVLLEEPYFNQFDNLTLAAMSYNDTDEAHDQFSGSGDTPLDADATWNISASILNANTALRVLVLRLSGGTLNDMAQIVAHISNPKGEAIH